MEKDVLSEDFRNTLLNSLECTAWCVTCMNHSNMVETQTQLFCHIAWLSEYIETYSISSDKAALED